MQAVKQAYKVLKDLRTRAVYDVGGLSSLAIDIDVHIFDSSEVIGDDILARAHLPFDVAAFGGVASVQAQRDAVCTQCQVRWVR